MEDFQRLITSLARYGRPVRAAFEAIGNDHRALAYHLATAGFEVKQVSSVALPRTRQALHNSWDKNDPKDAQVILHMMEIGNEQFYHNQLVRGTNDIQQLSKTHDIVSKSKTELWHRVLTHYLPLYVPKADHFHRSSRSDGFFAFLERYPSPHFISAMSRTHSPLTPGTLWAARLQKNVCLLTFMRPPKHLWGCLLAWILPRSVWSAWPSGKVAVVRHQSHRATQSNRRSRRGACQRPS